MTGAAALRTSLEIEEWLRRRCAGLAGVPCEEIDVDRPFAELGLDSSGAVAVTRELEALLRREVPITAFWDHPAIASLARALAARDASD